MFSGSSGFVGSTFGFTEEMFDEVTVCEVADSGGTGLAILSLCWMMKGFLLDGSGLLHQH